MLPIALLTAFALSQDVGLDEAAIAKWSNHIRPTARESMWERIPWHASFATGLRAARKEGKPLLLWVMNGHPLGCT